MSDNNFENEDDKPTVVLNLEELKKQGLKKDEYQDLDIEFTASSQVNIEELIENEIEQEETEQEEIDQKDEQSVNVVLFDFQTTLFSELIDQLPQQHNYTIINDLQNLNIQLQDQDFKIFVFYYNSNPKAVNQLTAQLKVKFPHVKTLIVAKSLSKEKALAHSKTDSGAHGYVSLPVNQENFQTEVLKIYQLQLKDG